MYSISTSWNSSRHKNGLEMVNELRAVGFESIELGFALNSKVVGAITSLVEKGLIKVTSVHNICPIPIGTGVDEASPDYYSLASADERERLEAIDAARNTIACAEKLGARAVILHTGKLPIKDRMKELADAFEDSQAHEKIKREMSAEREAHIDGYLDNVVKSLIDLVPAAKKHGVKIAIETRYSYRDIPLADEFEYIFNKVKDVWYWHDVGHAEVFERLGLAKHTELLDRYGGRLIGVHLHDITGFLCDHQAPLCGTFDFKKIAPYVKADTIKVIEAHQPATAKQIRRGLDYLRAILGD